MLGKNSRLKIQGISIIIGFILLLGALFALMPEIARKFDYNFFKIFEKPIFSVFSETGSEVILRY